MPERGRRGGGRRSGEHARPAERAHAGEQSRAEQTAAGAPPQQQHAPVGAGAHHHSTATGAEPTLASLVAEMAVVLEAGRARGQYGDAAREARELVAALHDQPRFWATLYPSLAVTPAMRDAALRAAERRAAGAPFAYAVGRASFRHLVLEVDERVLIPRPETEQLVELALTLVGTDAGGVAVDVGTGSGALALALASEGRFARVLATDISRDALAVAARNHERLRGGLRAPVELRHGSLLHAVDAADSGALRLVVSNPPYIAHHEAAQLPRAVRDWEPAVALFSAADGMALTARLVAQAAERLAPGGVLALETDSRRASLACELVSNDARFEQVAVTLDLFGRERFVTARRR